MEQQIFIKRILSGAIVLSVLAPLRGGAVEIVINPGAALSANLPALNAFNRAAALWESKFSDPVTVNINADLVSLGNPLTIGQAGSFYLGDDFDLGRGMLIADAADEASNGIVGFLPTAAQFTATLPAEFTLGSDLLFTKANAKALGYDALVPGGLDAFFFSLFGTTSDAVIQFNTGFSFDYDNSDGVGAGLVDFESVAAHEIGHALGFVSVVDDVDALITEESPGNINPLALDLFRFDWASLNPATTAEFTEFSRNLTPGGAHIFDDLTSEYSFATGVDHGDGEQASHWKDGLSIGLMDPTLNFAELSLITAADVRALDLIGWDVVPEPSTYAAGAFALLAVGGGWLRARRRA